MTASKIDTILQKINEVFGNHTYEISNFEKSEFASAFRTSDGNYISLANIEAGFNGRVFDQYGDIVNPDYIVSGCFQKVNMSESGKCNIEVCLLQKDNGRVTHTIFTTI